jgi:preprotein translocase subunit SecA
MDYLQEGINLRAMGQKDPLVEWQREGFDMFEAMMGAVEDDFVRYVFHLQVVKQEAPEPPPTRRLSYSAPEDPVQGSQALRKAAAAEAVASGDTEMAAAAGDGAGEAGVPAPVRVEKTPGRNEPCYCGSGKKYKFCHGR